MNVNIEKQDDKFILSVSFNDNRNVIGLPSMTINELNEIKNKITSFVTSFNTDKIFIPTNEIDLTQEVSVIVDDVLKKLEIHTAATILLLTDYDFGEPSLNKYCFDSALIAANKFFNDFKPKIPAESIALPATFAGTLANGINALDNPCKPTAPAGISIKLRINKANLLYLESFVYVPRWASIIAFSLNV